MPDFKTALTSLSPIPWSDVPSDNLEPFLKDNFAVAETLANSVPLPDVSDSSSTPPVSSSTAKTAADTSFILAPTELDKKHAELQKPWGKPIKINAKDNPLNVSVYKTAANDRRGTWFSRRSVHAGVSFTKWKNAMEREFTTSLKVKQGPGSGAIRGIAGDARLEKASIEGVGNAASWLVSSAFPGPVSPRDFVIVNMMSENALTEVSASSDGKIPRHLMVITRPSTHPNAGERESLIRGWYESVELMREIPGTGEDPEHNLIEWIMITRSDPGGGIPKFMVERGTPGSIVADVPKFIEWAINRDESQDDEDETQADKEIEEANTQKPDPAASEPDLRRASGQVPTTQPLSHSTTELPRKQSVEETKPQTGYSSLLGNLTSAIGSTVGGYLPQMNGDTTTSSTTQPTAATADDARSETSSTTSPISESGTFASAQDDMSSSSSSETPSRPFSQMSSADLETATPKNNHEKELLKLRKRRLVLDARMAKSREDDAKRTAEASSKEENERTKAVEKAEKDRKKMEEKYAKEVRQLEAKREKEERKAREGREKEERQRAEKERKAREKDVVLRVSRERDEARERLEIAEKEKGALEAQVGELQAENALLLQRVQVGVVEGGGDAVETSSQRSGNSAKKHAAKGSASSLVKGTPSTSTEKLVGNA